MITNCVITFPWLKQIARPRLDQSTFLYTAQFHQRLGFSWSRARVIMASLCSSTLACDGSTQWLTKTDRWFRKSSLTGKRHMYFCRTRVDWRITTLLLLQDTAYLSAIHSINCLPTNVYCTRDNNLGLIVIFHYKFTIVVFLHLINSW